jgi:hypothetical protein
VIEEDKTNDIRWGDYEQTGLYLILKDSTRLVLTKDSIEKAATEYWANPDKIPPDVKEAVEFQRCAFCPSKRDGSFCNALHPVVPLLDVVDKYVSFDEVFAIYKPEEKGLLHVSHTDMKEGLRYVSFLSLMKYCQTGRKYWKYYFGIIPILGGIEFAEKLYLNFFWMHDGDKESTDRAISEFYERITIATENQLARLRLICKNDAFLNAFVAAQSIAYLLNVRKDGLLKKSFDRFSKAEIALTTM